MSNDMRTFMRAVLTEAVRYEDLLFPLLKAITNNSELTNVGRGAVAQDIQARFDSELKWAKAVLRKSDRIIWYMKLVRIELAEFSQSTDYASKLERQYQAETGGAWSQDKMFFKRSMRSTIDLSERLEHLFSLPIDEIQNYQFRNQSIEKVLDDFIDFEDAWKKEASGSLTAKPEDEVVIDFHNGWVWMLLPRAYCSDESAAMGHCGNSPRQNTQDRILSLRKRMEQGGVTRWSPHLTFILRDDGMLTEMKGRGNDKPSKKYHAMIIALLKLPIIKGIVGGGYLPGNNFNISDLTPEQQKELTEANPFLLDSYGYLKKVGDDAYFQEKLKEEYESVTGRECDVVEGEVWFTDWRSIDNFLYMLNTSEIRAIRQINDWNFDSVGLDLVDDRENIDNLFREVLANVAPSHLRSDDLIATNSHRIDQASTRLSKVCERRARDYLKTFIEQTRFAVSFIYAGFDDDGDTVCVMASSRDLAKALHEHSLGGEDVGESYYEVQTLIGGGPIQLSEYHDNSYNETLPSQEDFVSDLKADIKAFWTKLFTTIINKSS